MNNISFTKLHKNRISFLKENSNYDHAILTGRNNILISAPHGVSQVRLGKYKYSEIGSLTTAIYLHNNCDCFLIAKTQNNNDDANFDTISKYKSSIEKLIKEKKIKYIIDIHGLSAKRNCDINLGTHLGNNIKNNEELFNRLLYSLQDNGFTTNIDQPFMANSNTISSSMSNKFPDIWTLQIEINCDITNNKAYFEKYKALLNILIDWIKSI